MATILNSDILNLAILDSAILVFPFKLTHTCQDWFPSFAQNNLHSFMMAADLDSASHLKFCHLGFRHCHVWNSDTLFSSLSFTPKHSPSTLILTQINSSDSNSFILNQHDDDSHLEFCHLEFSHVGFSHLSFTSQTHSYLPDWFPPFAQKKKLHSHFPPLHFHKKLHSSFWLTWWWCPSGILPSWILPSWIQLLHCGIKTPCFLLSDSLKNISLHSDSDSNSIQYWLKLIHSDSTWWWQPSWILPSWFQPFCTQKSSLIHSDLTWKWWWQPSWNLPSWIPPSCIQPSLFFLSNTLIFARLVPTICTKESSLTLPPTISTKKTFIHSFWLNSDDCGHLEFCHFGFNFWHLGFRHLVIFSLIHSKTLSLHSDSDSN